jgi:beta-catenin-like protein 1
LLTSPYFGLQEVEEFGIVQLRKLLASFERKFAKNQEMRVKFADDPAKWGLLHTCTLIHWHTFTHALISHLLCDRFMDSELDLHQEIKQMNIVATAPSLYSIVIKGGHVATLVSLLAHENTDVVVAVIDLLQDMTDVDTLEDNTESAVDLIEELVRYFFLHAQNTRTDTHTNPR